MKKKIALFFVLLFCYTFYSGMVKFDAYIYDSIWSYDQVTSHQRGAIVFFEYDDIENIEKDEFIRTITEILENNSLNAYEIYLENVATSDVKIFAYSNAADYINSIPLANNKKMLLNENNAYGSLSPDRDKQIFFFLESSDIRVLPFDSNDEDFNVLGPFVITNSTGEILTESQIEEFVYEVKSRVEEIRVGVDFSNSSDFDEEHKVENELFDSLIRWLPTTAFVVLALMTINSTMIARVDIVSKKKIEGYSNFEIFYDEYLKYVILYSGIAVILNIIIAIIITPLDFRFVSVLLKNLFFDTAWYVFLTVVLGMLLLYEIGLMPVNEAVKGKNYVVPIKQGLHLVRLVLLIFGLSIVVTYSTEAMSTLVHLSRREESFAKCEDVFQLYSFKRLYSSHYFEMLESSEMKDAYLHFASNNNAFLSRYSHGFADDGIPSYYMVDEFYLLMNGLVDEKPNNQKMFINSNYDVDAWKFNELAEMYEITEDDVIYYDWSIPAYSGTNLQFEHPLFVGSEILIYDGAFDTIQYDLASLMFTFDGSLEEAQEYVDKVLIDYGLMPYFRVSSASDNFLIEEKATINEIIPKVIVTLILIFGYMILSVQILELDSKENMRKYFLEYLEGTRFGSFAKNYLTNSLIVISITQISIYFMAKEIYFKTLTVLLIIIVVEIIFAYIRERKIISMKGKRC